MMSSKLAWGILSTGRIAGRFAGAVNTSETGELVAVGSRTQEAADKFGDQYNIPRRYASYEELLADPGVDAVYIATPHPMHAEWAIKAAEAGKHILCEKPSALNFPEAMAIIEAARANDVFLMEAFMYRCHPQIAKLVELIREKAIGDVRMIQASFSFNAGFNPESRLFNNALAGGGIMDVGCYCTSMSRLIAGAALGKDFIDPIEVKGSGYVGPTGVDGWAAGILRFPGDIIAQISTGVQLNQENVVRIFGTEGSIFVPSPWFCGENAKIHINRYGEEPSTVEINTTLDLYTIEADTVAANIDKRQAPSPAMSWDDTLGNMRALDWWRMAVGVTYDAEKPETVFPTADRRPLTVKPQSKMDYGTIPGLDKKVSRFVMGCMTPGDQFLMPYISVMFDHYFSKGGNAFDTAYIYGGGLSERMLGQWIKDRGVREQVVILAKGAHTPFCTPADMNAQFMETLERLQTDYVDIYMLHRDNPDIPVGEFVDALNEHHRAGRIRAFGGSNWSIERVEAANAYAKSKGLVGFSAVSNNFSLARMVDPVWEGCIASSDAESMDWHKKTQLPLMAWSSLARGFFVRGDENDLSDAEMVRCWYADDNFRRLERAKELAAKYGVRPVNIAMAYVLCQPFPTFALFGPATLAETSISLESLDIKLTPDELKWLNLED